MFGCKHFTPNFSGFFIYDNKRLRSRLLLYMTIENCEAGFLSYMTIENLHKAEKFGRFSGNMSEIHIFGAKNFLSKFNAGRRVVYLF